MAVLVLSTGAFFVLRGNEDDSSPVVLLLWASAYAVAFLGLLDGRLRLRTPLPVPVAITVFVSWALLSPAWSVSPTVSLRRAIALGGTVVIGLYLAQRLRPVEIFEAVRRATLVVAVASLLLYAAGDPRVIDDVHQTLRGVVATKNTLGRVMAIGLIATATVALLEPRRWRRCAVSAAPLVAALSLTDSAGGVVLAVAGVLVVAVAALWLFDHGKSALPMMVFGALAFLALVGTAVGFSIESILALTGRDATLTGRTDIWAQSLLAARERPWFGSGYGAFWALGSSDGSPEAARISGRLAEPVANAHNGLLEIWLDTGLIGVGLAVLVLGHLLVRGVADARAGRRGPATLRLLVLALVIVSTAAESGLLQENSPLTILVAAAAGTLVRAGRRGSATDAAPIDSDQEIRASALARAGAVPEGLPPAERGRHVGRDGHRGGGRQPVRAQRLGPTGVGRMTPDTGGDPR